MSRIRVRASRCLLAALVTMTAACAADAPREESWHLWEADNGGSVPEVFDLAAFITAGR